MTVRSARQDFGKVISFFDRISLVSHVEWIKFAYNAHWILSLNWNKVLFPKNNNFFRSNWRYICFKNSQLFTAQTMNSIQSFHSFSQKNKCLNENAATTRNTQYYQFILFFVVILHSLMVTSGWLYTVFFIYLHFKISRYYAALKLLN